MHRRKRLANEGDHEEGYGERFPFDAVEQAWHSRYEDQAISNPFPVKEGVFELLDYLGSARSEEGCSHIDCPCQRS